MLIHLPPIAHPLRASATFFTRPQLCANGRTTGENARLFGNVCACNRAELGDKVLAAGHGHRAVYVVVDRIGGLSDLDVWGGRAFRLLAGPGGEHAGRVRVSLRVVGHINVMRRARRGRRARR